MTKNFKKSPFTFVYITGLGHSGSTLLSLLLSSFREVTGLGEIDLLVNPGRREMYLKKFAKRPCTCGELPENCPVWNPFRDILLQNDSLSLGQYYNELFRITYEQTHAPVILDSSKRISTLQTIVGSLDEIGIKKEQLKVIHLVKDVRNFATSMRRHIRINQGTYKTFRKWKLKNSRIESYLEEQNIDHFTLGYEELALSTDFMMNKIALFLGLSPASSTLSMNAQDSHIAFGNNMRVFNSDKIRYDYRWFINRKAAFLYGISPGIQKKNLKWVYGNTDSTLRKKGEFKPPPKDESGLSGDKSNSNQ